MMPALRVIRKKFGMLLVLGMSKKKNPTSRHKLWNCVCECGGNVAVKASELIAGRVKSCGCLRQLHGMSSTPIYYSWASMIDRCYNKRNKSYPRYGGRGISVCEQWRSFSQFYKDMGDKPIGKSLDRFPNNNGNYEPGNCRWATLIEQAENTSKSRRCKIYGKEYPTMRSAARALGIHAGTIEYRLKRAMKGYRLLPQTHLPHPTF